MRLFSRCDGSSSPRTSIRVTGPAEAEVKIWTTRFRRPPLLHPQNLKLFLTFVCDQPQCVLEYGIFSGPKTTAPIRVKHFQSDSSQVTAHKESTAKKKPILDKKYENPEQGRCKKTAGCLS